MHIINKNSLVTNVEYNNLKLSWIYNNKQYEYNLQQYQKDLQGEFEVDIISVSGKKIYIYIRHIRDIFLNLEGTFLVSNIFCDKKKIQILNEKGKKDYIISDDYGFESVGLDAYGNIYAIEGLKIVIYTIHGKKINEYYRPENYYIQYISYLDELNKDEMLVVCRHKSGNLDEENRPIDYYFILNLKTGKYKMIDWYDFLNKKQSQQNNNN